MKRSIRWILPASLLTFLLAAALIEYRTPSFGQQTFPQPNRKPACTIFCGDGSFNIVDLYPPKSDACWGGPLPGGGADDFFKDRSEEEKDAICQTIGSTKGKSTSCPAFKKMMQLCKDRQLPDNQPKDKKCEKPKSPWLGSPSTDCKDFQSWQVEQTGGTVSLYICGYNVFSNSEVGKGRAFFSGVHRRIES